MNKRGDSAPEPDLERLARDWITLWQSELAAMAVDREAQEGWQALLALWAGAAAAILRAAPRQGAGGDGADGRSGSTGAPRATAAAAAPDARDAEVERLTRRVGELEARLAELERGRGDNRASPRRRRR